MNWIEYDGNHNHRSQLHCITFRNRVQSLNRLVHPSNHPLIQSGRIYSYNWSFHSLEAWKENISLMYSDKTAKVRTGRRFRCVVVHIDERTNERTNEWMFMNPNTFWHITGVNGEEQLWLTSDNLKVWECLTSGFRLVSFCASCITIFFNFGLLLFCSVQLTWQVVYE